VSILTLKSHLVAVDVRPFYLLSFFVGKLEVLASELFQTSHSQVRERDRGTGGFTGDRYRVGTETILGEVRNLSNQFYSF